MIYIVTCTYRCEGETHTGLVQDRAGKHVFATEQEATKVLNRDMREYRTAERAAGFKARIVSHHIEWDDDFEREAYWNLYGLNPEEAVGGKKKGRT